MSTDTDTTPMPPETLAALRASIAHWERITTFKTHAAAEVAFLRSLLPKEAA